LIQSFQLRWLAQELGIEKLVLKSNKMVAYFIANPQSKFYETPIFTSIISTIQQHPTYFKLSEQNDKLLVISENVLHLKEAFSRLKLMDVTDKSTI
jgi:transcription-repair coupling factor (superfamily II helicase)